MDAYESLGYCAALLVLACFCMRGIVALRVLAIASNLVFIAYGALAGIDPVLLLHLTLLPTNGWRLIEAIRDRRLRIERQPDDRPIGSQP